MTFDSTSIFGNHRSKRYALVVEDGKVKEALVEPDNAGINGMANPFSMFLIILLTVTSLRRRKGAGLNKYPDVLIRIDVH